MCNYAADFRKKSATTTIILLFVVNDFHCFIQSDDVHFWELHFVQYIIVVVFGDNVFCLCCHSTIDELVVVGVGGYQVEFVENINKKCIWVVENDFQNQ